MRVIFLFCCNQSWIMIAHKMLWRERSKTCFRLLIPTHTHTLTPFLHFFSFVYNLSHSSDTKKLKANNTTSLCSVLFTIPFQFPALGLNGVVNLSYTQGAGIQLKLEFLNERNDVDNDSPQIYEADTTNFWYVLNLIFLFLCTFKKYLCDGNSR